MALFVKCTLKTQILLRVLLNESQGKASEFVLLHVRLCCCTDVDTRVVYCHVQLYLLY
jgi:hypothetical protein